MRFHSLLLASALKCWVCESGLNPYCGEHFDSSKLDKNSMYTECPGRKCVKTMVSGTRVVYRSCAMDQDHAEAMCHLWNNGDMNAKCETCEKDGCNGASQYGPFVLLVALPVAIAKFLLN